MCPAWKKWSYAGIRFALALSFLVAGVLKTANPMTFAATIDAFGIVPGALALPLALILPVLEIFGALALLKDFRGALELIAALLVLFLLVLGYGLYMGLDIDCGCYGPGDPEAEAYAGIRSAVWRDAAMMCGVCLLFFLRKTRSIQPEPWPWNKSHSTL